MKVIVYRNAKTYELKFFPWGHNLIDPDWFTMGFGDVTMDDDRPSDPTAWAKFVRPCDIEKRGMGETYIEYITRVKLREE